MVCKVAYTLALPPTAKIQPKFHVSFLKNKIVHLEKVNADLPEFDADGKVILIVTAISAHRIVNKYNAAAMELLANEEAT